MRNLTTLFLFTSLLSAPAQADEKDKILGMPVSLIERAFVEQQNARSLALFETVNPAFRAQLEARAQELIPQNAPTRVNYFGTDYGVVNGAIVKDPDGKPVEILPVSLLPPEAKVAAFRFSPDQSKLAFGYSFYGSDWQTWRIFDLASKKLLGEEFTFKGFGGPGLSFTSDAKKVLYASQGTIQEDFEGKREPKILLHTLGEKISLDRVVFEKFEEPASSRWAALALTNETAVVFRVQGSAVIPTAAFVVNLTTGEKKAAIEPNRYLGNTPGAGLLGVREGKFYVRSAEVGPNFGIIEVNATARNPTSRILVRSRPGAVLYQALLVGDKLIAQYISTKAEIFFTAFDLDGKEISTMSPRQFGLNPEGSPSIPFTEGDQTSSAAYFTYSAVNTPPTTFRVDIKSGAFTRVKDLAAVNFRGDQVISSTITYPSFDGKKITMMIFQRADQGQKPAKFAYLFSYGFIGVPNLSQWNRKFQLALELGGIVAIPFLRGGGEYGEKFQLEGTNNREKTFQDLVFASRWLKKNRNIESKRVVAVGRSFGGLTGAVHYVHHQKDFDLISAIVPVTNWQKHFEGSGWWMGDDFGIQRNRKTGLASEQDAKALVAKNLAWDPAVNLKKLKNKKLIPGIFFSGEFDTNTTPHQSMSFVRAVLEQYPDAPVYLRQHPKVGHAGRAELVDELLFLTKYFKLTEIRPLK